ncbi:hypothetical protein HanLR1_Chr10g0380541 [Helianthus annuus]|nr:hypothetical protein HanHA89_Chr10g0403331 [Helianthus annuus]KAJ0698492.1 hypothetical protein HanLR1_Chr10g0380541 [Helianthus annuus]
MQIFTTIVITRRHKAVMFDQSALLSMVDKQGNKLAIMVHMKAMLPSFATWSTSPGMEPLRSTGNFIATDITVRKAELILKYLHGNHSFPLRMPCNKSATIVRMQTRDAHAIYNPIQTIGSLYFFSLSDRYIGCAYFSNVLVT